MAKEFDDLLPLFANEARARLEQLTLLAPAVEGDRSAAAAARRELHTLKGAARMLGVAAIAELSHEAENLLQVAHAGAGDLLLRVVDRLSAQVEAAERGDACEPDLELAALLRAAPATRAASANTLELAAAPTASPPAASSTEAPTPAEARLSTSELDHLTELATRMRILARGLAPPLARLFELAELAESGASEADARQILAALCTQLRGVAGDLEGQERRQIQLAEAQLETALNLQMQPLRGCLQRLARHARELARELGRELEVRVDGEQILLDRRIAREVEEALLHVVRNAVDHGIESAEQRRAAGKPAAGRLLIRARPAGARLEIVVSDDGGGIDAQQVVAAARSAGLLEADAVPDRDQALRLLLVAGFSTRGVATEISGRGIGLDVVAAAMRRAGGEVEIESQSGRGTQITLRVPLRRRGEEVFVVRAGRMRFALPRAAVERLEVLQPGALVDSDGRVLLRRGAELSPCLDLTRWIGERPVARPTLIVGEAHGQGLLLVVDQIEGEEEVVLRAPAAAAGLPAFVDSLALLASGEPVAVLSPPALAAAANLAMAPAAAGKPVSSLAARVLLVDDSAVTREMVRRLLDDAGFVVLATSSASEALSHLGRDDYDCLVTDVEMPEMDGFELTRQVRQLPRLAQLPVLIVSTLDRAEDRLRGLQAGADAYLTKQGLDAAELARVVRRLTSR